MPERKVWSQKEDHILRYLREQCGEKKWSNIARRMQEEFSVPGRTGKQCRQRYHNHLDASIVTHDWTPSEEATLILLHEEVGNKWSLIAQRLPGRSDNCVKNHFYSRLRKAVRRLNRLACDHRRHHRQIKLNVLYKIIETTEERFKINSRVDQEVVESCMGIKNRLFKVEETAPDSPELTALVEDINVFESGMKRSCKGRQSKSPTETLSSSSIEVDPQPLPKVKREEPEPEKKGPGREEEPFYRVFKRVCEEFLLNE